MGCAGLLGLVVVVGILIAALKGGTTTAPAGGAAVSTPTGTATPPPKIAPATAVPDPHALTVANVTQSIQDNKGFTFRARLDHLKVSIDGDTVTVETKPDTNFNENSSVTQTAGNALVSARAIFGFYPTVANLHVVEMGDFTDQTGHTNSEAAAALDLTKATADGFDYNGLKDLIEVKPSTMFCDADGYEIHPAIWKALDDGDKGCMKSPSKSP